MLGKTYLYCFLSLVLLIQLSHQQQYGTYSTPVPHPCTRQCGSGMPMICNYTFAFQNYYTMSKACFNCPYNITDCYRPQCIPGSGYTRLIYTTNVMMPGPIISVCENDTINVVVENKLMGPVTTVHWHGIFQKGTQYMDGVPYVTQCPITPYSSFQYTFPVHQYGTYFWHSHSAFQIVDGLAGLLVIRTAPGVDPNDNQYNFDLDQHTIMVSDFNNLTGFPLDGFHFQVLNNIFPAPPAVINGHGQVTEFDGGIYAPLEQFVVQAGSKYRFRMVNNLNSECTTVLSVEGHSLTVIATDGNPVKPYTVPAFASGPGERIDFVINANHSRGNFWMKFQGKGAFPGCPVTYAAANLHYNGSVQIDLTKQYIPSPLTLTFNEMLYDAEGLVSLTPDIYPIDGTPKVQLHFLVGANPNNDPLNYNLLYFPWDSYNSSYQLPLFLIDGIYMNYPASPLLSQLNEVDPNSFCNQSSITAQGTNCQDSFCSCIHRVSLPLNSVIEFVLVNTENDQGYHTFHLHGYAFRVVGQGYLPATNNTMAAFLELDKQGNITRNFNGAPLRDGVIVNYGGYAIIRFYTDNPGFWLFHCHMAYHFETGMGMVIQVGEPSDLPAIPRGFPTCGNFGQSFGSGTKPPLPHHPSKGHNWNNGNGWGKGKNKGKGKGENGQAGNGKWH